MKFRFSLLICLIIGTVILSGCAFNLGFEPVKLYKFSAELKYNSDNNILMSDPTIQLFTSYPQMCDWFDEFTNPYGVEKDREEAYKSILEDVNFDTYNLFGYMRYDGTGSTRRAVSLIDNKITFYAYTPNVVTDDIAYKWYIFEVDKKYSLEDFTIKHENMSEKQLHYLVNNYSDNFYF